MMCLDKWDPSSKRVEVTVYKFENGAYGNFQKSGKLVLADGERTAATDWVVAGESSKKLTDYDADSQHTHFYTAFFGPQEVQGFAYVGPIVVP